MSTEKELEELGLPTGLDLESLKQKYEEEKQKFSEGSSDDRFVRLVDGKTTVRILPPYSLEKVEMYEGFLNHRINKTNVICPRERKFAPIAPCPICRLTKELYNSANPEDKKLGKLFRASPKYYYNVIIRKIEPNSPEQATKDGIKLDVDPTEVKILSTGIKLKEKIQGVIFDSDFGDITNVLKGTDFVIKRRKIQIEDGSWIPNYDDSHPTRDVSPLAEDTETIKKILKSAHQLKAIVDESRKTPSELMQFLEQYCTEELGNPDLLNLINKRSKKTFQSFGSNPLDKNTSEAPSKEKDSVDISETEAEELYKKGEVNNSQVESVDDDLDTFDQELLSNMND